MLEDASQFRVGLAWQELIETRGDTGKDAQLEPADALPYIGNAVWHDHGFLGRSITLIALLFGAQFWFDVLRRLTGLRTTLSGKTDKK